MNDSSINEQNPRCDVLHSGVKVLDTALQPIYKPGNSVLIAIPTGGGKTILTGQTAGNRIWHGYITLVISTETQETEYFVRIASAIGGIEYSRVVDGIDLIGGYASQEKYGEEFPLRLFMLMERGKKFSRFTPPELLTYEPERYLRKILTECAAQKFHPEVVILDYIRDPGYSFEDLDPHRRRDAMYAASLSFKRLAEEFKFFGIAFCQVSADHLNSWEIDESGIPECKTLAEPADAFIGISRVYGSEDSAHPYAMIQNVRLSRKGKRPVTFPIRRNFAFQRFEDAVEQPRPFRPKAEDTVNLTAGNAPGVSMPHSENRGWVPMPRERLNELFALGNLNCVNAYCLLALVANYRTNTIRKGASFWSVKKIAQTLGLSPKMARGALDQLEEYEFTATDGNKRRALIRGIIDWDISHVADKAQNYFKLFRNLLDTSRADLIGKPLILRLWLYCLGQARVITDEAGGENPGTFVFNPHSIWETTGIEGTSLTESLKFLDMRGSIRQEKSAHGTEIVIRNWNQYQNEFYPRRANSTGSSAGV